MDNSFYNGASAVEKIVTFAQFPIQIQYFDRNHIEVKLLSVIKSTALTTTVDINIPEANSIELSQSLNFVISDNMDVFSLTPLACLVTINDWLNYTQLSVRVKLLSSGSTAHPGLLLNSGNTKSLPMKIRLLDNTIVQIPVSGNYVTYLEYFLNYGSEGVIVNHYSLPIALDFSLATSNEIYSGTLVVEIVGLLRDIIYSGDDWTPISNRGFTNGTASQINTTVINGAPYVIFQDSTYQNKVSVMKNTTTGWKYVGQPGLSAGIGLNGIISMHGLTPYIAYIDNGRFNKLSVMKYDGNQWSFVGNAGFSKESVDALSFAVYQGKPFVAFYDKANGYKASVMSFDGSQWNYVGVPGFSEGEAYYLSLTVYNDIPYLAFKDMAHYGKVSVMKYISGTWVYVGMPGMSIGSASYVSMAFNDSPYVAYMDASNDCKVTVRHFNGISWESIGKEGFSPNSASFISLSIDHGRPFVAFKDISAQSKAYVYKYNAGTWEIVGKKNISEGNVDYVSMIAVNNLIFVTYQDLVYGNRATSMVFR